MIDTKQQQANTEIKMLEFNLPNLVAKYQKPLAKYLATNDTKFAGVFKDRMALSSNGYVLMLNNIGLINQEPADFCFARKESHFGRKDDESYLDWAKRILINYRNWIKKEWSKEKKMTTKE